MAIDRSKFKGSSVAKMKQSDDELNKALGKDNKGKTDMLKVKEGKNIFRIYPAHDPEEVFAEAVVRVFLPMMVVEKKDGEEVLDEKGKKKYRETYRPIFNSRIHGGTKKDLVEQYIAIARKYAEENIDDKKKKQEYLDKLFGKYVAGSKDAPKGINYKSAWQIYADEIDGDNRTFGRLEYGVSIKNDLNKISSLEASDEPMATEPFTHPDDGRAVVINYDKSAKKASDYYSVSIDSAFDKVTKQIRLYPLSDKQWDHWAKQTPLKEMFRNVFKKSDFELQLEGLEYFDKKNQMGIFDTDEFQEELEEIATYYSEDAPVPTKEEIKKVIEEDESDEDEEEEDDDTEGKDKFDLMDRAELKDYNKKKGLGIAIKTNMTDDQLRDKIRSADEPIPHIPLPDEDGNDMVPEVKDAPPAGRSRLSRFRSE